MARFAANLSMLFGEVPFLDRFEAAAAAGFRAVEVQFPYEWPAAAIAERLRDRGLELVLFNLPAGDWAAGERGIACIPGCEPEFRDGVERAIGYAAALGCRQVNALAGIPPPGGSPEAARRTLLGNLGHAARRLAGAGVRLLVEPVNTRDVPGFFLSRAGDAEALLGELGAPGAAIQLDAYHAAMMGDDPARLALRLAARIGHVQIADAPGRHEPGTGSIDFAAFFGALERSGYAGWVGCEYKPAGATGEGLGWMRPWR